MVHTPPSWGRRVSTERRGSQANVIHEIYSAVLHLERFPCGDFLVKPALFGGIGTAEHLHFSRFHCLAGHVFLVLCNFLVLLKRALGSGWHRLQCWRAPGMIVPTGPGARSRCDVN